MLRYIGNPSADSSNLLKQTVPKRLIQKKEVTIKVCISSQIWELNSLAKRINAYYVFRVTVNLELRSAKDDLKKKKTQHQKMVFIS